jgi:hypothetical protein
MIATVCMFLAGKVEETPRPLREVIVYSYHIRFKKDPAAKDRIKLKVVFSCTNCLFPDVCSVGTIYGYEILINDLHAI